MRCNKMRKTILLWLSILMAMGLMMGLFFLTSCTVSEEPEAVAGKAIAREPSKAMRVDSCTEIPGGIRVTTGRTTKVFMDKCMINRNGVTTATNYRCTTVSHKGSVRPAYQYQFSTCEATEECVAGQCIPICGNERLDAGENCQSCPADAGCVPDEECIEGICLDVSSLCEERSWSPPPVCGNGIIERGEVCDDGDSIFTPNGTAAINYNGDGRHCSQCTCIDYDGGLNLGVGGYTRQSTPRLAGEILDGCNSNPEYVGQIAERYCVGGEIQTTVFTSCPPADGQVTHGQGCQVPSRSEGAHCEICEGSACWMPLPR